MAKSRVQSRSPSAGKSQTRSQDDGASGLVGNVIDRLMKGAVTVKRDEIVCSEASEQLVKDLGPVGVGHGLVELAANFAGHRLQLVGTESKR